MDININFVDKLSVGMGGYYRTNILYNLNYVIDYPIDPTDPTDLLSTPY